jgi:hypothetical protein
MRTRKRYNGWHTGRVKKRKHTAPNNASPRNKFQEMQPHLPSNTPSENAKQTNQDKVKEKCNPSSSNLHENALQPRTISDREWGTRHEPSRAKGTVVRSGLSTTTNSSLSTGRGKPNQNAPSVRRGRAQDLRRNSPQEQGTGRGRGRNPTPNTQRKKPQPLQLWDLISVDLNSSPPHSPARSSSLADKRSSTQSQPQRGQKGSKPGNYSSVPPKRTSDLSLSQNPSRSSVTLNVHQVTEIGRRTTRKRVINPNLASSDLEIVRRRKEREKQRPKKPTPLKRVIVQEKAKLFPTLSSNLSIHTPVSETPSFPASPPADTPNGKIPSSPFVSLSHFLLPLPSKMFAFSSPLPISSFLSFLFS